MRAQGPLADEVVATMAAIYASLQELNVPTWLRLDLPMAQFRALVVVSHRSGITVGEVGCQLSIGQSAASLLVDHLVRRGMIARADDPADRRRSLLSCTPEGEALLAELRHGSRSTLREWLALLNDDEQETLARGLRALARAAGAPASPADAATKEAHS